LEHNARGGTADDFTRLIHDQQKYRNTDKGYWVAQVDPKAARHAITGTIQDFRGALLTSDGAALLATEFKQANWSDLLRLGYIEGPQGIIKATRTAEATDPDRTQWPRYKVSDDASAVVCQGSLGLATTTNKP
jgi:hypothetical protein